MANYVIAVCLLLVNIVAVLNGRHLSDIGLIALVIAVGANILAGIVSSQRR